MLKHERSTNHHESLPSLKPRTGCLLWKPHLIRSIYAHNSATAAERGSFKLCQALLQTGRNLYILWRMEIKNISRARVKKKPVPTGTGRQDIIMLLENQVFHSKINSKLSFKLKGTTCARSSVVCIAHQLVIMDISEWTHHYCSVNV